MKKILFIIPPYINFDSFMYPDDESSVNIKNNRKFGTLSTDMPIGIMSLSSYIKKFVEIETKLIDFNIDLSSCKEFNYENFNDYFNDYFKYNLLTYKPDIVAISCLFTPSYHSMIMLANCSKDYFPNALIIGGGGIPTNTYRTIFEDTNSFDALCYGEGEKPLLELVMSNDVQNTFKMNNSWITAEKINSNATFHHSLIEKLDDIPTLDYQLCDPKDYSVNPGISCNASLEKKIFNFHIMTSRGCPYKCTFCTSFTVHGRAMRYHSVERVKEDLIILKEKFGAERVIIQDDNFTQNSKRAVQIIKIIKELGLELVFQNGLTVYSLTREMLELFKSAGIHQLVLPVESGSERVLKDIIKKPLNLSIVKRVVSDCRELGIYTNMNILFGFPGETKKDMQDTKDFLESIDANWYMFFLATPLVGTEMLKICEENNYLHGDTTRDLHFKKPVVETEHFTREYVQELRYNMNLELNFIKNNDVRLGNYEIALKGFENTIRAKNNHFFAHYFASITCKRLGRIEEAEMYKKNAIKYSQIEFWADKIKFFNFEMNFN